MRSSENAKPVIRRRRLAKELAPDLRWYWSWGDGPGGYVLQVLAEAAQAAGYDEILGPMDEHPGWQPSRQKVKIAAKLRTAVFERDGYRCRACGSWLDLTCDHIVAESRGGETDLINLQTLCRSCNSAKSAGDDETFSRTSRRKALDAVPGRLDGNGLLPQP